MAADKEKGVTGSASAEIDKYLDILAKDPHSRVFAPLAEAYRKAGLLDDAIETAIEGLKVHPNYLGGRVALGRAYYDKKLYAEAREEMQKVAKTAPDNIMAHKLLGQIAYEQSDLPGAEKAFRMVLLLDPRDREAKQFIDGIGGAAAPPEPEPRFMPSAAPAAVPPAPPVSFPTPSRLAAPPPVVQPVPVPEEIPPLEGLELHHLEQELSLPELSPPVPIAPAPPVLPESEVLSLEEISLEPAPGLGEPVPEPLFEFPGAVEELIPAPETASAAALAHPGITESAIEMPTLEAPPPATHGEAALPLEVFSRAPQEEAPARPPEESPFEVFGRPKRSGPPVSSKGEQEAFKEIELESTFHEPTEEPAAEDESPFENFTRIPRAEIRTGASLREAHGEGGGGYHEIEFEPSTPTAEIEASPVPETAPVSLDEEIPQIDLAREMEVGREEETPSPPLPVQESAPMSLEEEIPRIDLSREVELPPAEEDETGEEETAAPAAARGVFDTETLASIYISQGFFGRAAEIYEKLVQESPGDEALRRKLADVLAQERTQAAAGAAVEPSPALMPESPMPSATQPATAPALPPGDGDETIRRLQILLESLKGGRPR